MKVNVAKKIFIELSDRAKYNTREKYIYRRECD